MVCSNKIWCLHLNTVWCSVDGAYFNFIHQSIFAAPKESVHAMSGKISDTEKPRDVNFTEVTMCTPVLIDDMTVFQFFSWWIMKTTAWRF
jgi:hypothetical protein